MNPEIQEVGMNPEIRVVWIRQALQAGTQGDGMQRLGQRQHQQQQRQQRT